MTVKTYKSCSDLPIYNFMMCIHSNQFKWLICNADALSDADIDSFTQSNTPKLQKIFESIKNEYKALTFEKRELQRNKELASMQFLEVKHNAIIKIVSMYLSYKDIKVLDLLNDLDVGFDKNKPIQPQLQNAKRQTQGLRNRLNIKQAHFKKKYKIDDLITEETSLSDIEKNLDSQALSMEANLETGYRIDIKATSILRWVNLMENNRRKIDQFNSIKK